MSKWKGVDCKLSRKINRRKHKPQKMTGNSTAVALRRCAHAQNERRSGSIERTCHKDHRSGVCFS